MISVNHGPEDPFARIPVPLAFQRATASPSRRANESNVVLRQVTTAPTSSSSGLQTDSAPPNCGQVQCHSTTTNLEGYAFDTLDAAKKSLNRLAGTTLANSELVEVLHADGDKRMPPDSPLADEDIALVEAWIEAGRPGL